MKNEEIVALFWERSERALTETQVKYQTYGRYIARNILGNAEDAEECFNEALGKVWNSIPPQRPANFKAYFGKIVRETAISRWRAQHAKKRSADEFSMSLDEAAEIASDDEIEAAVEKKLMAKAISDFLRTLPDTDRNLMIRRYWYEDSIKDLCERFGFSEGKVKVRLQRTRAKLREYLKKEGWIV